MRSSAKTGKGAKSRYFSDGLGSIRELTDQVGTVQHSYTYGARGELRAQNITVPNSYGYTGREFAEEGLYFYRARYLDPGMGRFVSKDPIGFNGGMNFYGYVGNNPISFIDPLGLECKFIWEPGKDIPLKAWEKVEWEGYWRAHTFCSIYYATLIYFELFEVPPIKRPPDFCKFTIVTYYYGKFEESLNYYEECRDDCGELKSKILLFNAGTHKTHIDLLDTKRETAYSTDYFWWQAIGK